MKVNKYKIIIVLIIFIFLVLSFTGYRQYKQMKDYISPSKISTKENEEQSSKKQKVKTVVDHKHPQINKIDEYLEQTHFNGTIALLKKVNLN